MSITNDTGHEQLQRKFLQLTEANQQYILGLADGLKQAESSDKELLQDNKTTVFLGTKA